MSCHRIDGAFQSNEVNIGWRLGQARLLTEIRTKPGGGELVGHLDTTDGCGIQTVRNPDRLPAPPTRPPLHGADHDTHIWVYARNGSDTGWVREQDIAHEPVNLAKPPLRGPAGRDFEVGRTLPAMKPPSGCGKLSVNQPVKIVDVREAHLRYSPHGTSFHYLHRGDHVKVLIVNAPQGFHLVEVLHTDPDGSAPTGTRAWIIAEALA